MSDSKKLSIDVVLDGIKGSKNNDWEYLPFSKIYRFKSDIDYSIELRELSYEQNEIENNKAISNARVLLANDNKFTTEKVLPYVAIVKYKQVPILENNLFLIVSQEKEVFALSHEIQKFDVLPVGRAKDFMQIFTSDPRLLHEVFGIYFEL